MARIVRSWFTIFALVFASNLVTASARAAELTDQFVVKYRAPLSAAPILRDALRSIVLRTGIGGQLLRQRSDGSEVWKLDRRVQHELIKSWRVIAQTQGLQIEFLDPDGLSLPALVPNDTYFYAQTDLSSSASQIDVQTVWNTYTGSGVRVAVIDTGYTNHIDLAANIVGGYDFIGDVTRANDGNGRDSSALDPGDYVTAGQCGTGSPAQNSSWHGTHVSGTIAALTNNGMGVAGIAFGAKVVPLRVLGKCGGYDSDIADAITWAAGGPVSGVPTNAYPTRVINMSLGRQASCPTFMQTAIDYARSAGAAVIAAAGNNAADVSLFEPANCGGVIAVASVSTSATRSSFSNFGAGIALSAPGENIYSTLNAGLTSPYSDTYGSLSGTSMAAPHVAGVAALMLQANPALKTDDITWKLIQSARAFPSGCSGCGAGLLDAGGAISAISGYSPPSVPLFSVSLVSDDFTVATWQVTNTRTTPVVLSHLELTAGGSGGASIQSTTCPVGGLLAGGASCSVTTLDGQVCGGPVYYKLTATNSAGTALGSDFAFTSNASCGG